MKVFVVSLLAGAAVFVGSGCVPVVSTSVAPVAEVTVPALETAPPPPPTPVLDPSAQLAADLKSLATRLTPVLEGFGRWAKAITAGLPAQPDELANLRVQLALVDQDARALRDRAHADGISPHVQRAADGLSQTTSELTAAMGLADETMRALDQHQGPNASTFAKSALDHTQRAIKLIDVVSGELQAYTQETQAS